MIYMGDIDWSNPLTYLNPWGALAGSAVADQKKQAQGVLYGGLTNIDEQRRALQSSMDDTADRLALNVALAGIAVVTAGALAYVAVRRFGGPR